MRKMRCLALLTLLCLLLSAAASAEEAYTGPDWSFGVSLKKLSSAELTLANKDHPMSAAEEPTDLVTLRARRNNTEGENTNGGVYLAGGGTCKLRPSAANAAMMLMNAAESHDLRLYLRFGYRSYADTEKRYERAVALKDMVGVQKAGESDFQTGLAVVLVGKDWRGKPMGSDFLNTPEWAFLQENAAKYGFIVRYPEGKESLTGNTAAPWILRYVGDGVAGYITGKGLCLEEFVQQLDQAYVDFEAAGGILSAVRAQELPEGPVELNEKGPDGDAEIVLFHD